MILTSFSSICDAMSEAEAEAKAEACQGCLPVCPVAVIAKPACLQCWCAASAHHM